MERPNARGSNNFVVGLFVFVALLVGAGFIVFMGGSTTFGGETKFKTIFADVRGLNVGAPVYLQGIQIGRVSSFEFPETSENAEVGDRGIVAVLSVYSEFAKRVKEDSQAEISTQGMLGDKIVSLTMGSTEAPALKPEGYMRTIAAKDMSEYLTKGGDLVETLNEVARNLNVLVKDLNDAGRLQKVIKNLEAMTASMATTSQNLAASKGTLGSLVNGGEKDDLGPALASLRKILEKVNRGQGTLGALVNDATLHEDLKILLGGAKRSQTVRFLLRQAISASDEKEKAEQPKK